MPVCLSYAVSVFINFWSLKLCQQWQWQVSFQLVLSQGKFLFQINVISQWKSALLKLFFPSSVLWANWKAHLAFRCPAHSGNTGSRPLILEWLHASSVHLLQEFKCTIGGPHSRWRGRTNCSWSFVPALLSQTVEAEASRCFSVCFLGQKSATSGTHSTQPCKYCQDKKQARGR